MRGGTALTQRQKGRLPLGEEPILRHSDFSVFPDTGDNIPALLEYTHRFFVRNAGGDKSSGLSVLDVDFLPLVRLSSLMIDSMTSLFSFPS